MLKIFTDECIHTDLVKALIKAGFDVKTTRQAKLVGCPDQDIFDYAVKSKRVLLTFDRGFGDIFRFDIAQSQGIVIILTGQLDKQELIDFPIAFLCQRSKKDLIGKLVIIGQKKIRLIQR